MEAHCCTTACEVWTESLCVMYANFGPQSVSPFQLAAIDYVYQRLTGAVCKLFWCDMHPVGTDCYAGR